MDQLPALGTAVGEVVMPTFKIYNSLLQKNATAIKSTPRKTFTYGSDPRQSLDIYYPSSNPTGARRPILFWIYGGGLTNGSKTLPAIENGLAYANLGHFFAEKCGFVVVIPDYRLVPQAKFPSGGEDIALAVEWLRLNLQEIGGAENPRDFFIMGNSAGGIHLSTYLFYPGFDKYRQRVLPKAADCLLRLRGAVLLSVPYHFELAHPSRAGTLATYYGDDVRENCPFGLLKSLKERSSVSEALPGIQFISLIDTLDPEDELLVPNRDFEAAWKSGNTSNETELQTEVIEGHNHISPCLAVGTAIPQEEAWGFQIARFCGVAISQ